MNQQRYESLIHQVESKERVLRKEYTSLDLQREALQKLLRSQRPQGITDRSELYAIQRRLSILRRQLSLLDLQEVELKEKQLQYEKEKEKLQQQRQYWRRKSDKYLHWQTVQKRSQRLIRLRQEETEMEDIITCGK
ncbi:MULTISPECIES: type III needle complex assembly protein [Candidatus Fukatsuia]|nr:type III needle complex assembly protein [Candidatus Fukatsuia symbiotica]